MNYANGDKLEVMLGDVVCFPVVGFTHEWTVKDFDERDSQLHLSYQFGTRWEHVSHCTLIRRADQPGEAKAVDAPETPWGDWAADPANVLIMQAATGRRGPEQQRIAAKFRELTSLCLKKNHDYGSTFARPPCLAPNVLASEAVLVRMSDKIGRLQQLLGGTQPFVMQESLRDTIRDLSVYGILWELAVEMENEEQEAK